MFSSAYCGSEKILRKLVGKTDVEDALSRLDMLTKEETLMMVVRNLEVTHHVDGNVKATKVVAEDIDNNVKVTKLLVEDIEDNVKGIEGQVEGIAAVARSVDNCTHRFLSAFMQMLTVSPLYPNIVARDLKRLMLSDSPSLIVEDDTCSQGTRCKRNFDHGFLLQIPRSIIIQHVKLNTLGQQHGLFKARHSRIGRRTAPYYGSVEIVRFSSSLNSFY